LFKSGFTWGAAAASYQVEGAWNEDGKGLSVWDMFCSQKGKVWRDDNGNTACNHYHLYQDDVKLMNQIGLRAYRLSISWPRVLPEGTAAINQKGIEFYDRLVDRLLENKIQPWITLFHWDFPYALFLKGGWLNPESPEWFAEYTRVVIDRLSDRVSHWITLNEPQAFIGLGHQQGLHAPGLKLGLKETLQAGHHALLAHGKAVQVIRAYAKTSAKVSAAQVSVAGIPLKEEPAYIDMARRNFTSFKKMNMWNNTWFADPTIFGEYPEEGLKLFEGHLPEIKADDMKIISEKIDFFAANVYHGAYVDQDGRVVQHPGGPMTTMDWDVMPRSLYWAPRFLHERYNLPIVITENGMAGTDWIHIDGQVHDAPRIDFLYRHLRELKRSAENGVPVEGYFLWSIIDNFEWAEGYKRRFGIIYVDYETQKRTLKDSAYWYGTVIKSNGENL